MSLKTKQQDELIAIIAAGAAIEMSVNMRLQHDLVALAIAAKAAGTHLTLTEAGFRMQHDLVAIAMAGKGHVTFKN